MVNRNFGKRNLEFLGLIPIPEPVEETIPVEEPEET